MWFGRLLLTLCVLVSLKVNESKYFKNYKFEYIYNKHCGGDFPWILSEYSSIGIAPFNENNTKGIQAITKSCALSRLVNFSRGVLELVVFLRLFSNKSGLTVAVLNEKYVHMLDYGINRFEANYTEGWHKIFLHLDDDFFGYINLKGHVEKGEMIIVDSLHYAKSLSYKVINNDPQDHEVMMNLEMFKIYEKRYNSKLIDFATRIHSYYDSNNRSKRSMNEYDGTIEQPKDFEIDELSAPVTTVDPLTTTLLTITAAPDTTMDPVIIAAPSPTSAPVTTVDPVTATALPPTSALVTTVAPVITTATTPTSTPISAVVPVTTTAPTLTTASVTTLDPVITESPTQTLAPITTVDAKTTAAPTRTSASFTIVAPGKSAMPTPTGVPVTNADQVTIELPTPTLAPIKTVDPKTTAASTKQNNFWSPLTITLVAVGSFVVLGITTVSAYYCGKIKATPDDVNLMIQEEIPPQQIIPRVRNVNRFEV